MMVHTTISRQTVGADSTDASPSSGSNRTTRQDSDELIVRDRRSVADGVVELTLQRPDGTRLPDWSPGAHIDLILPSGTIRQYSLCGDRWDPYTYRVAVQREDGGTGGSVEIHRTTRIGSHVRFGGPRNNFRLAPASQYAFIAGGIGITALLPMIGQADRMDIPWRLLYLGRDSSRMAYRNAERFASPQVKTHTTADGPRISVGSWLGELDDAAMVYACGPQGLLDALPGECPSLHPQRIRTERFVNDKLSSAPINSLPYEVALERSGRTIRAESHQSVAEALSQAGIGLITSCARGVCGTCELAVLGGEVDHRDTILDDEERAAGDCMFPGVSRAAGERLTVDL